MLYTNFSQNWNNSLLNENFSDIRVDDTLELYQPREIKLQNVTIGMAKIVAMRRFPFSQLTDELALTVCGHNALYLATVLQRMYGKLNAYDNLTWVVYEWLKPDRHAFENMWQNAWEKSVEKFMPHWLGEHAQEQQMRLEFHTQNNNA